MRLNRQRFGRSHAMSASSRPTVEPSWTMHWPQYAELIKHKTDHLGGTGVETRVRENSMHPEQRNARCWRERELPISTPSLTSLARSGKASGGGGSLLYRQFHARHTQLALPPSWLSIQRAQQSRYITTSSHNQSKHLVVLVKAMTKYIL